MGFELPVMSFCVALVGSFFLLLRLLKSVSGKLGEVGEAWHSFVSVLSWCSLKAYGASGWRFTGAGAPLP